MNIIGLLKSLPKKFYNNRKADTKAIYYAIDIASDGSLSLIKESIAKSYQGFLEAKFNNLILDMACNNVTTEEFLRFINSKSHSDREFMNNLIIKNLHADNRITIYILATLSANKIKNGSLNYYESSLFTNINAFTRHDYECFYELWKNKQQTEKDNFIYTINKEQEFYIDAQIKLFSFGILESPRHFGFASKFENERKLSAFKKTGISEFLFNVLKEYFDTSINDSCM